MPVGDTSHQQFVFDEGDRGKYRDKGQQSFRQNTVTPTYSSFQHVFKGWKRLFVYQLRAEKFKNKAAPSPINSRFGHDEDRDGNQESYVHRKIPKERNVDL